MIVAKLVGGLGNQLFQFAAAKALANHHNVPLQLDVSFYEKSKRNFMLDNFSFPTELVPANAVASRKEESLVNRAVRYLLPPHKKVPFQEPHFHFYQNFFKAPSNTRLTGLWQSEKYFAPIKDTVKKEFLVKPELVSHLQEKAQEMKQQSSVSVHIRRGDYLHPAVINNVGLGILSEEYYKNAIAMMMEKHPNSKLYFFSDDIAWVKEFITQKDSFNYSYEFVSDSLTKTDVEDFYLMQQCKHNIIANSTFSWWCGWLNNHPDKIVIAPEHWYNKPKSYFKDLIPAEWHQV